MEKTDSSSKDEKEHIGSRFGRSFLDNKVHCAFCEFSKDPKKDSDRNSAPTKSDFVIFLDIDGVIMGDRMRNPLSGLIITKAKELFGGYPKTELQWRIAQSHFLSMKELEELVEFIDVLYQVKIVISSQWRIDCTMMEFWNNIFDKYTKVRQFLFGKTIPCPSADKGWSPELKWGLGDEIQKDIEKCCKGISMTQRSNQIKHWIHTHQDRLNANFTFVDDKMYGNFLVIDDMHMTEFPDNFVYTPYMFGNAELCTARKMVANVAKPFVNPDKQQKQLCLNDWKAETFRDVVKNAFNNNNDHAMFELESMNVVASTNQNPKEQKRLKNGGEIETFPDVVRIHGDDDDSIPFDKGIDGAKRDSRLFFPMIEEKMNSYEYPYMTATLSELICMLKMGGSRSTFLFEDYALASILIKAIMQDRHRNVAVFFSGRYARARFIEKFKKAVRSYHIGLGRYDTKKEFDFIGDIEVSQFNEEVLRMKNGLFCEFFMINDRRTLRGISLPRENEGFTIIASAVDTNSSFFREFFVPMLCQMREKHVILSMHIVNDDKATQMRKSIGFGSPTLKMVILQYGDTVFEPCTDSCRSCKKSNETWEDELEILKKSTLHPWVDIPVLMKEKSDQ
jgi:hypothetical protein